MLPVSRSEITFYYLSGLRPHPHRRHMVQPRHTSFALNGGVTPEYPSLNPILDLRLNLTRYPPYQGGIDKKGAMPSQAYLQSWLAGE